ncbi:unnamed protein product [Rhizoctonia solani]|uniref:DUF6535 domain-containing protein n=1 Tax=Rhizoctonia solani TaxID=456999 RepID=A0A8H3GMM6_9AGAM|nr:unnamed protein product [Rhizoctonia solani]
MLLYMLGGKVQARNRKQSRAHRSKPHKNAKPQPVYPVDPPQEFDEPGKELEQDAQVWKTYVRETDQVDGELVDGWNKSMDVILIFAALFSAISTAFVIESYKNLKPDPADISAQTLLTISQTLAAIANGSRPTGAQSSPDTQVGDPPFSASSSAICVNVLWFLSLSLSVAVSLISMLAKEWCLKFMSGRTGPPGLQARRRQLRWEKLVSWKMEEVLMILPSIIHLSLLLFAIGLSVFLWDVHFGVAIPVVFVTTVAAAAYVACTVLPFIDRYCPYGTVLSLLCRRFTELQKQTTHKSSDLAQDETTAKALYWMIENCETPRSVDVALQSLAGATKGMPYKLIAEWDIWTTMRRRLGAQDPFAQDAGSDPGDTIHARALHAVTRFRDNNDGLGYGSKIETRRLEALALGLQSCIDSFCNRITTQEPSSNAETKMLLCKCAKIGVQLLKSNQVTPMRPGSEKNDEIEEFWSEAMDPEQLLDEVINHLERHMESTIHPGPTAHPVLYAVAAFLFCSCSPSVIGKTSKRLLRVYLSRMARLKTSGAVGMLRVWHEYESHDRGLSFLLGLLPVLPTASGLTSQHPEKLSQPIHKCLEISVEYIWQFLIAESYSDKGAFDHYRHRASGASHLLIEFPRYSLSSRDCDLLVRFAIGDDLPYVDGLKSISSRIQFIKCLNGYLASHPHVNWATLPPQLLELLRYLLQFRSDNEPFVPAPEIYLLTVKSLCRAETIEQKRICYELMTTFPFPKLSLKFTQLLFTSEIVDELANAQTNNDPSIQAFATAQLWLFFNMSLEFPDRTSGTLNMLENALLKYPVPEGDVEKQGLVVRQLEAQLMSLIGEHYDHFKNELGIVYKRDREQTGCAPYLYRILECIMQKQSASLPESAKHVPKKSPDFLRALERSPDFRRVLEKLPDFLRGWNSSMYLEGETSAMEAILANNASSVM